MPELLRLLTESGHDVTRRARPRAALQFVGAPTWAALSGHPSPPTSGTAPHEVPHVAARPAGRPRRRRPGHRRPARPAAHGLADDLLTNTLLTARCPVVLAPAMHTEMWEHPATAANVATLRRAACVVLDPAVGPAHRRRHRHGPAARAGGDLRGLPLRCWRARRARRAADLAGRHVVVSAGGTREPLDPVRFLGNRSSGRQGYALAATAAARGAPGHAGRGQRRRCPTRPASSVVRSARPRSCGTRCSTPPPAPTPW